ncbi:MAG: DUF885 domain-containing protein [Nocardioidaceae bacterium]|nr:DUF885 domain-containing protein [Nocardioidaceae bacterium]MDQ3325607.1 DUF885 domain-containing protein [Actinomycetota bacterium]
MNSNPHAADRPVDALADAYVDRWAALDPLGATEAGIGGHQSEMTDLSPDGVAARRDLVRETLAALAAAEPADSRERVAKAAMSERLGLELERQDAGLADAELSVLTSGMHEVREVFDLMDTDGADAVAAIDSRLSAVPGALAGWRATMRTAAGNGRVAARRQVLGAAHQALGWTGARRSGSSPDVFGDLVAGLSTGSSTQRDQLHRHAGDARAALAQTAEFLIHEIAPLAPATDAIGRESYQLQSRWFLGASVDLDETYAWGWAELHRITEQQATVAQRIVAGGSTADAVAALDADPHRWINSGDAFRDWIQVKADAAIADLADVHFDIPDPVRRIECRLAPTHDGGIYYTGPSEDFTRPGRMWWSVPDEVTRFSPWRELTTVYHEGVPGHHLQIGQTAYRSDLLNRWQRLLCWVSGHGEGWALYAERLMDDLGYLEDPADALGMLESQSFRAARVVVDIGMHLQLPIPVDNPFGFHPGEQWTPELMLELLHAHSTVDEASLRFERDRYLGWPGQAPSYKVGERIWLQARADVEARLGADFDLRTFHRAALDLGSLGLDPLRHQLAQL